MSDTIQLHDPAHSEFVQETLRSNRVLWMDVEMRINDTQPAMVGYIPFGSMLGTVESVLCDESFAAVANMKRLPHMPWLQFVHEVVVPVIEQKGVVAAYSEHERELIVEALHRLERSDLVDELIYLDCNAKKCFRKCFPEDLMRIQQRLRRRFDRGLMTRRRPPGLKDFLCSPASTYDYPRHMRQFSPAEALAYIRPQAAERLPRRWTPAAKRQLCELLKYNEHDVLGMRHLTLELMTLVQ
jgi:hypothetical protein